MFTTDRDLIILEPRLFFDISWTAQKLLDSASGGSINSGGDTLTLAGAAFDALGIGAGFIALIGTNPVTPLEVVARLSATTLQVSRLRASESDALIPAASGSSLKVVIHTFRPQLGVIHSQLLRLVGIEPGSPSLSAGGGTPGEADITNPRAFALAEALGALHLIFASAAALVGMDSPLWIKAQMYRDRFRAERSRLAAEIDLNGDGEPDTTRRANVLQLTRE